MKIAGYIMVHYGADYLAECIQSLSYICDKIIIIYTDRPTHTDMDIINGKPAAYKPIGEDIRTLQQIAYDASNKVVWISINMEDQTRRVFTEGAHRNLAFEYSQGFDMLVTLDTDEVWEPADIEASIREASGINSRYIGVDGFINFWRSFDYYLIDWFHPHRLHNLRSTIIDKGVSVKSKIYHFGYAIKPELMKYKMHIHGHKSEIRPGWFDIWNNWTPDQLHGKFHMVSEQIWHDINLFDKNTLPTILRNHKYFNTPIIK